MEQKRTLCILIAAGVFLCVVFGAAFIMSRNAGSAKKGETAISLKGSDDIWIAPTVDASEPKVDNQVANVKSDDSSKIEETSSASSVKENESVVNSDTESSLTKGLEYPAEGESTAVASAPSVIQTDSLSVIANGPTNIYQTDKIAESAHGIETTTFDLTSGSSSATAVTAQNKAAEKAMKSADSKRGELAKTLDESTRVSSIKTTEQKVTAPSTSAVKPTATTSSKTAATTTAKTTATKPVEKTVESSRLPDRFWVQAASYSSKKKADEARAVLDENKVQCEVFTFEMDGTLYYRVRVGPYTTKTEATYWKKQVDSLEQFADAGTYIVNSSAPIAKK